MSMLTSLTDLLTSVDDVEWMNRGACGDLPIEAIEGFFVEAGGRLHSEHAQLCGGCTVRADCLAYALQAGITAGYYGGVSPSARRRLERSAGDTA